MSIYLILSYCAVFMISVPLSISLIRYRHLHTEMKILAALLLVAAITELVANVLAEYRINNLPILHFYSVLEFGFLATIYYHYFHPLIHRAVYHWSIIIFALFALFNALYIQRITGFNTYPLILESIVMACLALLFFRRALKLQQALHIERTPMFWFSAGHLIYFAGNLSVFAFSNFILEISNQLHEAVWGIHSVLLILLYINYSIALMCR